MLILSAVKKNIFNAKKNVLAIDELNNNKIKTEEAIFYNFENKII